MVALLGKDEGGLSASTIGRLKEAWSDGHVRWSKRDLSAKRYVYFWADGIHVQAHLEDEAQCLLVIIGATPDGKKELVGLIDGARKSAQSWRELLLDLKRAGFRWRLSLRSPTVRSASRRRSRMADDPRSARLGPQDCQRLEQAAEPSRRVTILHGSTPRVWIATRSIRPSTPWRTRPKEARHASRRSLEGIA